jgi:prophage regulatory protein
LAQTTRAQRSIIRNPEVQKRTGLSGSTLWRLEQAGQFPARVQLGSPQAVGWYEDEVDDWVNSRSRAGGKQPPLPKNRRALST